MLIPSPSTLFNLGCSDSIEGAFETGRITNLIGDSSTGKTLFALSTLAQMAVLPAFKDYALAYDDCEHAFEFDLERMFGKRIAQRLREQKVNPPSNTMDELFHNVFKPIKEQRPFIYVLDSYDGLVHKEEMKRTEKLLADEKTKGTYGLELVQDFTKLLKELTGPLTALSSHLIVISQTRVNLTVTSLYRPKKRNGGEALRFYSSHEVWLARKKNIAKKEVDVGQIIRANISKNKLTGKRRDIDLYIYDSFGIDDITPNLDFLLSEKTDMEAKKNKVYEVPELKITGTYPKIIKHIEENNLEKDLKQLVQIAWDAREETLAEARKNQYYDIKEEEIAEETTCQTTKKSKNSSKS